MARKPTPLAPIPVNAANISLTTTQVVALSSGTLLPHAIPSGGKIWTGGNNFHGQLSAHEIAVNLAALHANVVARLFAQFGADKFTINSGFRNGPGSSQHDAGMACDIQVKPANGHGVGSPAETLQYANWIKDNCLFDQLAMEYSATYRNQCWIHVSYVRPEVTYSGPNRKAIYTWDAAKLGTPQFSTAGVFQVRS